MSNKVNSVNHYSIYKVCVCLVCGGGGFPGYIELLTENQRQNSFRKERICYMACSRGNQTQDHGIVSKLAGSGNKPFLRDV